MAARSPRKIFANPFVVTLAAMPACFAETSPPPQQPQPQVAQQPAQPVVVANPPPVTPPPASSGGTAQTEPKADTFEMRWTVTKSPTGCQAMARVDCPKPKNPGGPVPTCNPPPPMKVACPDGWDGTGGIVIVRYANQTECRIEEPPMKCPANATCNPPPPRKVACPTYQ